MASSSRRLYERRSAVHQWPSSGQHPWLLDLKMFIEECEKVGMPNNTPVHMGDKGIDCQSEVEVDVTVQPRNQNMEANPQVRPF